MNRSKRSQVQKKNGERDTRLLEIKSRDSLLRNGSKDGWVTGIKEGWETEDKPSNPEH